MGLEGVGGLQPDGMFIFQVTLTLRLDLCPPQSPLWPERSQRA